MAYFQASVGNGHNFKTYFTSGNETGTRISAAGMGAYREYGVSLYSPKSALHLSFHDVGQQYAPVDGLVSLNDVRGPTLFATREFDFGQKAFIQSVTLTQDSERFSSHSGVENFSASQSFLSLNTRSRLTLSLSSGSAYLRAGATSAGFIDQYGIGIFYKQNTTTPSGLSYKVGRFGNGYVRSWTRAVALPIGSRGSLALELDDTADGLDNGAFLRQWLERVSFAYQFDSSSSVAIAARRIIGSAPVFFSTPTPIVATNLSVALYKRFAGSEIYIVFGDPNQLATQHSVIFKLIEYVGAQKGT